MTLPSPTTEAAARRSPGSLYRYRAYGLRVCAEMPLPELVAEAGDDPAAITVRYGRIPAPSAEERLADGCYRAIADEAALHYEDAGTFLVRSGREIIVDPLPGADPSAVRLYTVGSALGLALHQRGQFTLHASAVSCGEGSVAFAGESGEGKSTMAAAMHARGHLVMSDDIVAVDSSGEAPLVHPAFPRLKLSPPSAVALGYDPSRLAIFHPDDERRHYGVGVGFAPAPLPLRAVYILTGGATIAAERLSGHDAFLALLQNAYALLYLGSVGASARHFQQCAALARTVPVYTLSRPYAVAALPAVARFVEGHAAMAGDGS